MKFFGDYHIHSSYSDGSSSIEEMVNAASQIGLKEIGLADHGPRLLGARGIKTEKTLQNIKEEIARLKKKHDSLKIFAGVEANVIGRDGQLDLSRKGIEGLDFLIAGLHPYVLPQRVSELPWLLGNQAPKIGATRKKRVRNNNTKALVEALHRYDINILSHPGLKMEIEISETARACVAKNTLWEINTGHQYPGYEDVLKAAHCGVDFIVNSDAHFPESVGYLDYGSWVLEKAGVPVCRVKNAVENEEQ